MWYQRILIFLIAVFTGIWDASFSPWLPLWMQSFQLVLTLVTFTGLFFRFQQSLIIAFVGGGVLALIDPATGGFTPLRYIAIALFIYLLASRIFTNRSLIGVIALSASVVLLDRVLLLLLSGVLRLLSISYTAELHAGIFSEALCMIAINVILFMGMAAFSRRFMPSLMHFSGKTMR